jgi:hypothetical protein
MRGFVPAFDVTAFWMLAKGFALLPSFMSEPLVASTKTPTESTTHGTDSPGSFVSSQPGGASMVLASVGDDPSAVESTSIADAPSPELASVAPSTTSQMPLSQKFELGHAHSNAPAETKKPKNIWPRIFNILRRKPCLCDDAYNCVAS